jgi:hypothetical protein
MRWHLIIEEFRPMIKYIEGPKNNATDALSHLNILLYRESIDMADCYGLDDDNLPSDSFLLTIP